MKKIRQRNKTNTVANKKRCDNKIASHVTKACNKTYNIVKAHNNINNNQKQKTTKKKKTKLCKK